MPGAPSKEAFMSIVLYYAPMTSATRIHWALEELGVDYEKKKVDLAAGEQKRPEFLALNPNGKVPLLVDDGHPIFEGLAILLHLGERYGVDRGLFPAPGPERSEAFQWIAWAHVTLVETLSRLLRNTSDRFPADERNEKAGAGARREIAELLGIVDRHLAGREFLVGSTFSLADVALSGFIPFMSRNGVDLAAFERTNAWVARCIARPALARVLAG
jgi:glutathione S-transferase